QIINVGFCQWSAALDASAWTCKYLQRGEHLEQEE
ncbi:unnamed protein product, partial [marine sediment metagenome]